MITKTLGYIACFLILGMTAVMCILLCLTGILAILSALR